jgi:hypothetical protein
MTFAAFISRSRPYEPEADVPLTVLMPKPTPRAYALGLKWFPVKTSDDARALAKAEKAAAYCFVPKSRQVGLVHHPDQLRGKKTYCAGATFLQARKDDRPYAAFYPLAGTAFHEAGYFWVIVVKDRKIQRDEVMYRDAAIDLAETLAGSGEFPQITAPAEIYPKGNAEALHLVLAQERDPLVISTQRTLSVPALNALPTVPGWLVGALLLATAGVTWTATDLLQVPEIREIAGPVRTVKEIIPITASVRAIPDPAYFLVACDEAMARLTSLGQPVGTIVTCTAPTGTAATWTVTAHFPNWPIQSLTGTLTIPPHELISSADSGFVAANVLAAISAKLPASIVTLQSKANSVQVPVPGGSRQTPSPTSGLGATPSPSAGGGVVGPGAAAGRTSSSPLQALTGPTETPMITRTTTEITLGSKLSPAAWAHALARAPIAIETITRSAAGQWTVAGKVL